MADAPVQDLTVCNELLGDRAALDGFLEREGYLYFREVVDPALVDHVVSPAIADLQDKGILDRSDDPRWTGRPIEEVDEDLLHRLMPYDDLWLAPSVTALFEGLFGEPVFVFKQTQLRVMAPSKEVYNTPPHQDAGYIQPHEFRTVWVPLRDAPKQLGGLGLVQRSHTDGVRTHLERSDHISFTHKLNIGGVTVGDDEVWLTSDFRVGDLLFFSPYMVHRSMPNRTDDRLRFSMDTRVQPARTERGFVATHTAMEVRDASRESAGWFPEAEVVK